MHISGRKAVPVMRAWNTLEELRLVALSHGCTPAQFAHALEVMGTDTRRVAAYLQQHEFFKSLPQHRYSAG